MNIAELLKNEQGKTFTCDVEAIVKKPKSKLMNGDEWTQECVLSDLSGDISSEVLLCGNSLERGNKIRIISGQMQNGESGVKLFVIGYVPETATEPEPYQPKEQHYTPAEIEQNKTVDWQAISTGKVRHGVVCAYIQAGIEPIKDNVIKWVNFIMSGK
jgi:hypothetical protein